MAISSEKARLLRFTRNDYGLWIGVCLFLIFCSIYKNLDMAFMVSREGFERLVDKALERVPEEYRKYFTNITIIVEDYPSKVDIERAGQKNGLLLGLFSGVPYPSKRGFFNIPYPLPDRIILYQRNIEKICSNEEGLIEQVRKTLIHEVGHYFGLSEEELRKYE